MREVGSAAEARRQNPSEGAAAGIHSGLLLIAGGMESGDGRRAVFNFAHKLWVFCFWYPSKIPVFLCSNRCLLLIPLQIPIQEAGQQEPEAQRLRDGHREGGAAWLRTELEAKNYTDLRRLCAMLGLPQRRDGGTLGKEQLLESIVDCFSSQEGWSKGMGIERC